MNKFIKFLRSIFRDKEAYLKITALEEYIDILEEHVNDDVLMIRNKVINNEWVTGKKLVILSSGVVVNGLYVNGDTPIVIHPNAKNVHLSNVVMDDR